MSTMTSVQTILQTDHHKGRYVMPAESAQHSHILMGFPGISSAEDEKHLEQLQIEVIRIANAISQFEPVHLYARKELVSKARSMAQKNVIVKTTKLDQLWVRDSGPVYVRDSSDNSRKRIGFNFNYWGDKLPKTGDENVAEQIEGDEFVRSRITIEGGGIEIDGEGTFLGTESCIINDNRNPGLSKAEIEAEISDKLGVTNFIWTPGTKGYDITDFHIDALARFIEPGVVLLSKPAPNAPETIVKIYEETREILLNSNDAQGRSLTVHDCEEPDVEVLGPNVEPDASVASYANYLLVNKAVIMPKFGQDRLDKQAFEMFQKLFPSREVVQVELNMLPRTGGGIHCATQQVPQV